MSESHIISITGLPNIGNSCYLNSSIQLCKLITGIKFKDAEEKQNSFITDIQTVFQTGNNDEELNRYMRLYTFIANNLQYQLGSQQDNCEVVQFIIDKYVDLIKNKNKLITRFNQVISCSNCSKVRICSEQKESMLISHELNNSSKEEIEFNDFFTNIITPQNVETINTECGCSSPSPKVQTILTKLPEFLFIKVGRCKYDTSKIYKRLKFNSDFQLDYPLNLHNYINGTDTNRKIKQYILIGIVIHHGDTSHTGHYSAIIRGNANEKWVYCDDMRVVEINIEEQLEYIQKNCSLLLYKTSI